MQEASYRPERILKAEAVYKGRLGVSRSKFYTMLTNGEFPPAIRLSPMRVGWLETQVSDWIKSRPVVDLRKPDATKPASMARDLTA